MRWCRLLRWVGNRASRGSALVSLPSGRCSSAGHCSPHFTALRAEPFDGLNNLFQIPFALPWFLIPIGGIWSHETDAWIAAGMGWFNGLLILMFLPAWLSRRLNAQAPRSQQICRTGAGSAA
jgi:hypothetical protein